MAQRNRSAFFSSKYLQSLPIHRGNKHAASEKEGCLSSAEVQDPCSLRRKHEQCVGDGEFP